ncbi:hypothetical protein DM01DRAFT_1308943 [Hesseltinella vesiculosa]|uniref:HotDog ACOT-type domain-containing protein n=1 Tax=Hesseltinella vesiculosa TaxID=101127 RepID=A0A1X2GAY6_9FUNG|nr:hypothetical protein DM01DRAFT_1308943 [Hesseltinella vesiculosa]
MFRLPSRFMSRHLATSTRHVRGAQPSILQDFQPHTASKTYTVRPVAFWMDKILAKENKKQLFEHTQPRKLVLKSMNESYMEEFLPFKSSPALLDEYVTKNGAIRHGKILEDLDALAGAIAYKHVDNFTDGPPVTLVTASVDRMDILMPSKIENMKISGHVSYVGSSSMEVFVKIDTMPNYDPAVVDTTPFPPTDFLAKPNSNTVIYANFTMVALDSVTNKSVRVNPLRLANAEEKSLFMFAEDAKHRKRLASEADLSKKPPTEEERVTLHELYMKYTDAEKNVRAPAGTLWMEDTRLQSVILMQPQDRNIHNKVFGGYLLRCALELAHATGSTLAQNNLSLVSLDESSFRKPVPVGSVLKLQSQVTYTQESDKTLQVSVVAQVQDIEKGTCDVTNTFHFTFASPANSVPRILPKTYAESILYLEGKRRNEKRGQAKESLLRLMSPSTAL